MKNGSPQRSEGLTAAVKHRVLMNVGIWTFGSIYNTVSYRCFIRAVASESRFASHLLLYWQIVLVKRSHRNGADVHLHTID